MVHGNLLMVHLIQKFNGSIFMIIKFFNETNAIEPKTLALKLVIKHPKFTFN